MTEKNTVCSHADDKAFLDIRDLTVTYESDGEVVRAVNDIALTLGRGETLGLVGETGAGKTTLALSIMGLLPERTAFVKSGEINLNGTDLLQLNEGKMRLVRGNQAAMIFQDPMTSLNPVITVGDQIRETLELHNTEGKTKEEIAARVDEVLTMVGIPPDRKHEYPHQFSGGMKQRVVIAIALACEPDLLIADEPTTALDVTIQAQVLRMMRDLRERMGTSMIMITHDLGIVAQTCDKVAVMYAGEIVEYGTLADIFGSERHHPYTTGLFGSIPKLDDSSRRLSPITGLMPDPTTLPEGCYFQDRCPHCTELCRRQHPALSVVDGHGSRCHLFDENCREKMAKEQTNAEQPKTAVSAGKKQPLPERPVLIETRDLCKYFKTNSGMLHAVDKVNISIRQGETLGVVGESGCGKSTLGRTLMHLLKPTDGQVLFKGEDTVGFKRAQLREMHKSMQLIFQDPYSSLNPRMTVSQIIAENMLVNKLCSSKEELWKRTLELMDLVGLARRLAYAYPHELDGGRRQRICVARALSVNPEFIVCDEPVSALDVSIQAQILNLLMDLQDELGLTYMFITHDLSVVRHISDHIAVMYLGQLIEKAPAQELFTNPRHPYTQALLSAIPIPDISQRHRELKTIRGELKSPINPAPGCRFAPRCEYATDACRATPELVEVSSDHYCACHLCR